MTIKASSAVPVNGTLGDWLRSTVGGPSGLSPLTHSFQLLFLDRVVTDVLEDHEGTGDA